MQKWEHKLIEVFNDKTITSSQNWVWEEDGRRLPGKPDVVTKIRELGYGGWELVSTMSAGVPVHMQYWFKRPLPDGVPPALPKTQ